MSKLLLLNLLLLIQTHALTSHEEGVAFAGAVETLLDEMFDLTKPIPSPDPNDIHVGTVPGDSVIDIIDMDAILERGRPGVLETGPLSDKTEELLEWLLDDKHASNTLFESVEYEKIINGYIFGLHMACVCCSLFFFMFVYIIGCTISIHTISNKKTHVVQGEVVHDVEDAKAT